MIQQVDFYILANDTDRHQFACQLVEKAYKCKHRIFIQCNDEPHVHQLDDQLWIYKKTSFIPHNIQGEGPEPPPPVQLGFTEQAPKFSDILINLSLEIPSYHHQFKRIIEIVDDSEPVKQALRKHYRYYQSQSYPIYNHKISPLP